MRISIYYILLVGFLTFSCQDNKKELESENVKDQEKKELIFQEINKSWNFNTAPLNPDTKATVNRWEEWRIFLSELKQKPKSDIGAFQKKSRTLAQKVIQLNNNIPAKLNKPSVKSRIAVLTTQIRSLDLYIHLQNIPQKKVVSLIPEINAGVASLQSEFEEIIRKEQIPLEQGESDLIKMRDTSRAIPTTKTPKFRPRFEQNGFIQQIR